MKRFEKTAITPGMKGMAMSRRFVVVAAVVVFLLLPSPGLILAALESSHPDCPACAGGPSGPTALAFDAPCPTDHPCHNPNHRHHNHPVRDARALLQDRGDDRLPAGPAIGVCPLVSFENAAPAPAPAPFSVSAGFVPPARAPPVFPV
ncbi:MAG: hypothetical protein V1809_15100 [Planctomycetota bacterium]